MLLRRLRPSVRRVFARSRSFSFYRLGPPEPRNQDRPFRVQTRRSSGPGKRAFKPFGHEHRLPPTGLPFKALGLPTILSPAIRATTGERPAASRFSPAPTAWLRLSGRLCCAWRWCGGKRGTASGSRDREGATRISAGTSTPLVLRPVRSLTRFHEAPHFHQARFGRFLGEPGKLAAHLDVIASAGEHELVLLHLDRVDAAFGSERL